LLVSSFRASAQQLLDYHPRKLDERVQRWLCAGRYFGERHDQRVQISYFESRSKSRRLIFRDAKDQGISASSQLKLHVHTRQEYLKNRPLGIMVGS